MRVPLHGTDCQALKRNCKTVIAPTLLAADIVIVHVLWAVRALGIYHDIIVHTQRWIAALRPLNPVVERFLDL